MLFFLFLLQKHKCISIYYFPKIDLETVFKNNKQKIIYKILNDYFYKQSHLENSIDSLVYNFYLSKKNRQKKFNQNFFCLFTYLPTSTVRYYSGYFPSVEIP